MFCSSIDVFLVARLSSTEEQPKKKSNIIASLFWLFNRLHRNGGGVILMDKFTCSLK
jgi:hypothetical protein